MLKKIRSLLGSNLIQSSSIYTISSIFEKAIPFFLLPILTRYLSTEDYGIVSMFSVLVGLTIPFVGVNTNSAILRSYYKEDIKLSVYITNIFFVLLVSSLFVAFLFLLIGDTISQYSQFPVEWLYTVFVVAIGQFIINVILVIWQGEVRPIPFGIFKVLLTSVNMALAIFLIVGMGYGWKGRVIGKLFAITIFSIIGLFIIWKKRLYKFRFNKAYIKHALEYGGPLIPHVISLFSITMIDRFFITNMVGIGETGIYTVGYQVGMIIGVLTGSFNKAWTPWLFDKLNEDSELVKKKIIKFTYGYIFAIILITTGLSIVSPWLMSFFVGKKFYKATQYITWIAFGYAFHGMYLMVTNYIFYEEKTYLLSWVTFVAALINIVLNYFLITAFGAIGAAQATTVTYFIQFIITWHMASRVNKMPWLNAFIQD